MRIAVQSPLSVLCAFPLLAAPSDFHLVSSEKEVLKRPAREVKGFNEDLASTSTKMLDVMYSEGGIGLAGVNVIIVNKHNQKGVEVKTAVKSAVRTSIHSFKCGICGDNGHSLCPPSCC